MVLTNTFQLLILIVLRSDAWPQSFLSKQVTWCQCLFLVIFWTQMRVKHSIRMKEILPWPILKTWVLFSQNTGMSWHRDAWYLGRHTKSGRLSLVVWEGKQRPAKVIHTLHDTYSKLTKSHRWQASGDSTWVARRYSSAPTWEKDAQGSLRACQIRIVERIAQHRLLVLARGWPQHS